MTAGVTPDCETANLPARRFGRPPELAHPIFRDNPLYRNSKRQLRGALSDEAIHAAGRKPGGCFGSPGLPMAVMDHPHPSSASRRQ